MCGIFGLFNLSQNIEIEEHRFRLALKTLRHRGPDFEKVDRFGNKAILGHTRLSIIDLRAENNQPFSILRRYWIAYNGEIYNYLELRKELERKGVQFRTDGDTEVLLYAYAQWGEQCVSRFNGMWAFAIYDIQENMLFCSRDRFGVKPFNYVVDKAQFMFSSEIKAILAYRPELAQPEYNAIANYCRTSVGAQSTKTWFKSIMRLPPGSNLTVRDGQVRRERYWHYPKDIYRQSSFDEACESYADLFKDSVRLRMRSDVPLGITLSSGIDSSSIAYMMHAIDSTPHHCFTARFLPQDKLVTDNSIYNKKTAIDESISARRIADELDLNSHVVDTDYSNFLPLLDRIVFHLESGNSSPAVIPLMQLLNRAKTHVKVLLDGQGADELMGGYILNTIWPSVADLVGEGRLTEAALSLRQFGTTYKPGYAVKMLLRDLSNDIHLLSWAHQRSARIDRIYGPVLREYTRYKDYMELPGEGNGSKLGKLLMHQHAGGLINLLHYGDAISMANSIESRMPFLDYRLVEFVWRLPSDFKVRLGIGKYLHRQAMRNTVPDWVLDQRMKFGFSTPISQQFRQRHPDGSSAVDVLLESKCAKRGLFNVDGMRQLVQDHRAGQRDHGPLLFRLLSTELWFRRFIDAPIVTESDCGSVQ